VLAREPQGPIQTNPDGLLGFLGIKGQGVNPNSLAGFVQPTIDVDQYFLASRLVQLQVLANGVGPFASGSVAFITPCTPPSGRTWIFNRGGIGVTVTPTAVQQVQMALVLRKIGGPVSVAPIAYASETFDISANAKFLFVELPEPLVLSTGWELRFGLSLDEPGAFSVDGSFQFLDVPS